jgi:DNA-binding transcriptional LysR family regulator
MNLASFDLNLLRVLDALLRERSTVRAGERVGLSQPAVSAALARLRQATGDPLFVRQGLRLVPTDFARSLEGEVRNVLDRVETLLSVGRFDPATARGVVRIGAGDFFHEFLVPSLAEAVARAAPGLSLRFLDLFPADYAATLDRHEVDLALIPALPLPDWIVRRELFRSRYAVIARQGHPRLAHLPPGATIPIDLFCDLGHAMFSSVGASSALGDKALAAAGRRRRVALTVPSFYGMARAVSRSDLIALLVRDFAAALSGPMGLTLYEPPIPVEPTPVLLIWHRKSDASPAHRWLRDLVAHLLAPLGAS